MPSLFEAMLADLDRAKREDQVWVEFFDVILGLNKTDDRLEAYKRAQQGLEQESFDG